MENLKEKNLSLFLNYFSGLGVWDKFGMLSREIAPYKKLADEFKTIYIFSYGDKKELDYQKYFPANVVIIHKSLKIPDILYEFLLPFIHHKVLKQCAIFKTNQNSGAIAPTIAKLLFRKPKLIVRSGYIGSEFARLNHLPLYARAYYWLAESLSYRFCDRAFIPTESGYTTLIRKYPVLSKKLIIMNNSIDTELFSKRDLEKRYDIIYVARFDSQQKNHLGLLEAAENMGWKLLLVGRGEIKDQLIETAKRKNVDLAIIEKVPNNQLPDFYNTSRICAFPSLFEGNPKALLECMSSELPIVAFDVPGVNNLIKNNETGLLSEPNSAKLRENIQKILSNSELAASLGKNARKFILENYAFEKLLAREIQIYIEI